MKRIICHLAALLALAVGTQSFADVVWRLDEDRQTVRVWSEHPQTAALRLIGQNAWSKLTIEQTSEGHAVLRAAWPLMAGQTYELHLDSASGPQRIPISVPVAETVGAARVSNVAPSSDRWPANTLRVHIFFATPMARGQAADYVTLIDASGRSVPHAFLNLGIELWSADQRRLTLMFDPGRLKRGVGPNAELGAPLTEGSTYAIRVEKGIKDAARRPMRATAEHWFTVGPAEHRPLNAADWVLARGADQVLVRFDRAMDAQSAQSTIQLRATGGAPVSAEPERVGNSLIWRLPAMDRGTDLEIAVAPALEDVSGNTICAAFDAALNWGHTCRTGLVLPVPQQR